MSLSAADLQRRHHLEGAPDPFPSLGTNEPTAAKSRANGSGQPDLDTESQQAFPSLAPALTAGGGKTTKSAWSTAGPRIKPSVSKQTVVTDSFTVSVGDLTKDGKPTSLGEVMKQVMAKYKVKVEASTNQRTRQSTFHLKSESKKELEKAKRSLLALLSPAVTVVINAPASTIPSVIGPKGVTLKQIRDQTSVRIDIPRKDTLAPINGHPNGASHPSTRTGSPLPSGADEDEEPLIPISVSGREPLVHEAEALLNAIIATKTAKSTQRIRDIPAHVLPFVFVRRPTFMAAAEGADITLSRNEADREITVTGDREAVHRVADIIRATVQAIKGSITPYKASLPKRQHRLLVGKAIDEIMAKSNCAVVVSKADDPSDEVIIWGRAEDLGSGFSVVMEKANSQYIHEFTLPGPINFSRQLLTYMTYISYSATLNAAHPGVVVYTPSPTLADKVQTLTVDFVGEKAAVDSAIKQISTFIGQLLGATKEVEIDWLLHRVITGKNAKKIKQFHDVHNVQIFFPAETTEKSSVLLVYDPTSASASPSPVEKAKHLEDVEKELLKLVRDAADVKSETVAVEKRWHEAVVGRGGTTLNAIIGEDKTLSIKVGAEAGDHSNEDVILVRGASADVDRAVNEILRIVEEAKNDEIDNSHSVEFEIDREFVGRIVGAQGSGVNKLRDQLGVKVDFSDEVDEKEKEGKKKKTVIHQKSKVKIIGRKENVEEAKRRILTQVERLADETSEVLKIPNQYHSSLIGQSGKYVIRLEEKYSVKITFPRESPENGESKTREYLKSDEVLVKGGRKGVAGAKAELLDAVDFEKESNNLIKFTVPSRCVARILGKGGVTINEIKDDTGAQIDVDKASEDAGPVANISVRGTKKAIAAAKAAIMAIADQVGEEATVNVKIESKYHRTIIGAGGQGLKNIVTRCGGPSDPKLQAGLIKFPRQGDPGDEVRLRGDPALVNKLKAELEKTVTALRDRVVLAVEIPAIQHRALIGRGGQHLNDLQDRTGAQVQFPGSRSYSQVGEPENASDFTSIEGANIVKVSGPRAACEKAVEELKAQVKPPAPEGITDTVSVPLKYHHVITQQGNFFRNLRSFGVAVDQSTMPKKSALPSRPATGDDAARIDDVDDDGAGVEWQVVRNYQDAEEGDSVWTLRARDQAGLDKAKILITEAIEHAEKSSHVGFLTLSDRSLFPRIVGSKGANVSRLRAETGAEITVGRDNNTIVMIGSELAVEAAKEAIINIASNNRSRGRNGN